MRREVDLGGRNRRGEPGLLKHWIALRNSDGSSIGMQLLLELINIESERTI